MFPSLGSSMYGLSMESKSWKYTRFSLFSIVDRPVVMLLKLSIRERFSRLRTLMSSGSSLQLKKLLLLPLLLLMLLLLTPQLLPLLLKNPPTSLFRFISETGSGILFG
ncbi:hypothetical protein EGW08_012054 [Elysia chlorotica]|uniref:Uncharacterized protein n=1 Tax=Elysia chlorotica TaxID=188477 RepID=A0A3S1BBH0_ELYCH|nr:hypothetical protein EGW08_012054 [Elysia chlorotica]